MYKRLASAFLLCSLALVVVGVHPGVAWGRTEVSDDGTTPDSQGQGEQEAQKYFRGKHSRQTASDNEDKAQDAVQAEDEYVKDKYTNKDTELMRAATHYMALHVGGFLSSDSYQWDGPHNGSTGNLNAGLTYRMSPVGRLADWALRADFIGYTMPDGKALQIALLPLLLFPESFSKFPIYFGFGAGLGIFPTQLPGESVIGIHYQLIAGVRFFNVLGTTGFFMETGLKNHILLLSQGQFNGFFLAVGPLFTF